MSSVRDILILAKSIKKGRFCVAGIDVYTGEWIRPVSTPDGEGIDTTYTISKLKNNKEKSIRPLDVVRISLDRHVPLKSQPENWLIGNERWSFVGDVAREELSKVCDAPPHLWMHGTSSHRLGTEWLDSPHVDPASLYLVPVHEIGLRVTRNFFGFKRTKATFGYRGIRYDLNVTDPAFGLHKHHDVGHKTTLYNRFLCISRTDDFDGYCYKVVASIL